MVNKIKKESILLQYQSDKGSKIGEPIAGEERPLKYLLPNVRSSLGVWGRLLVALLTAISLIYDFLTQFYFYLFQKPSPEEKMQLHKRMKSDVIKRTETSVTYRSDRPVRSIHLELEKCRIDTMHKVFTHAIKKNGPKKCLGTRQWLKEEETLDNGFKKLQLGEYVWKTYDQVDHLAAAFARGLTTLNITSKDKICIFAETRAEWLIAAVGAFKHSFTIVTLYATLGEDAIIQGLNEVEATVVLTSNELLPKFKSILSQTPHIQHLIYMEHPLKKIDTSEYSNNNIVILPFSEVIERGENIKICLQPPEPEDVAIIMYTSGSTGKPKGVLLSHRNISAGLFGFTDGFDTVCPYDIYVAYLPLAHVLELMCEGTCFLEGVPIGYSSPLTLTNNSPKITAGTLGDAAVLKPTLMVSVPFALDKIYKLIHGQVNQGGCLKRALFYFSYDYKLKWTRKGYNTPLVDALVMKKVKMALGGRIRIIVVGGAPLAEDTHEFIRNCVCHNLSQGYALTETCAAGSCTLFGDLTVGRVGPPLRCCELGLVNWEEGGYTVDDNPLPRGEIVVGGENVALGYFKLPEETKNTFFMEDARRWCRTGDIAQVDPDGSFRIIDRKKDLVKLQMGEYLSMGKIESVLKTCQYVDNICIYGDSSKSCCVALVIPAQKQLESLASGVGKCNLSMEEMCKDAEVKAAFLHEIQTFCAINKLARFEIPAALKLCSEIWTPDNNLITAAFKLRRRNVQEWYKSDIDSMYEELKKKSCQN